MSTLKVDAIRHNSATSDAITMASDGTCTAKITGRTGGGGLSNRNLIINGAMQIAQRNLTSTANGFGSVDRFAVYYGNVSESPTQSQSDVGLSDLPFTEQGITKCLKVTNGNQTSTDNNDYIEINNVGFNLDGNDSEYLSDLLIKLKNNPKILYIMKQNSKKCAARDFDQIKLSDSYLSSLLKVFKAKS